MTGIYKIQSKKYLDRFYIGSAVSYIKRKARHTHDLRENKHHSRKLQNHVNKHGIEDLEFSFLERCSINNLLIMEQKYLDKNLPYFNILSKAGSNLGIKRSITTKLKMSEAQKLSYKRGNRKPKSPHSLETIEKIRKANIGIRRPSTFKKLICIETNEIFECVQDASNKYKINPSSIASVCRGIRKSAGGYTFIYL